MARNIRHMTKPDVDALLASRGLAVPPPSAGVHFGGGVHVDMPDSWNQEYGYPPPGWTGYNSSWEDDGGGDDWQTTMPEEDEMNAYIAALPPGTITGPDLARINQAYAGNPNGTPPGPPPHANNP